MFSLLRRRKLPSHMIEHAVSRAVLLRLEKLQIFESATGVSERELSNCIESRADAQMVVVIHDSLLLDFCIVDAAIAIGIVNTVEATTGNYDLARLGFTSGARRKSLHKLWEVCSPLARANLDYQYRLLLKPYLLDENEKQLVMIFQNFLSHRLQLYFSFNQSPDIEWLHLLADLKKKNSDEAISRIESWRRAA